jgi:hypothetical protein
VSWGWRFEWCEEKLLPADQVVIALNLLYQREKKINHSVDLAPFEKKIRRGGRAKPQRRKAYGRQAPRLWVKNNKSSRPPLRTGQEFLCAHLGGQVSAPLREKNN